MPVCVVGLFESIEVDAQNGKLFAACRRTVERGRNMLVEAGPVRQAGQRIIMRQVNDPILRTLPLCYVFDNADHISRLATTVADYHSL